MHLRAFAQSLMFCLLHAAAQPGMIFADEAVETPEEIGAFLMDAAWSRAETLKTGVYDGTEIWTDELPDKPAIVSKSEFHGAFDFPASRVRFDYRTLSDAMTNFHYLETPEECVVYSEVTKYQITRGPFDGARRRNREFFDVRCLGLMTLDEVSRGKLLSEIKDGFIKGMGQVTGKKPVEGSIWQLEGVFQDIVRTSIQLDAARNYIPVHVDRVYLNKDDGTVLRPVGTVTVDWEPKGETWVPKKVIMVRHSKRDKRTRELSFNWSNVNTEVPEQKFQKSDWTLIDGTSIVDDTHGEPILLEVIGEKKPVPAIPKK